MVGIHGYPYLTRPMVGINAYPYLAYTPDPTHPGAHYVVRANPLLRCKHIFIYNIIIRPPIRGFI